jgi:hypothetical protein
MKDKKKGQSLEVCDHLKHPGIKRDKLCNHCAKHLHHPQIPTGAGAVDPGGQELYDPKKGFKDEK